MKGFPLVFLMCFLSITAYAADVFRFSADRMSGGRAAGKELTVLSGNAMVISNDLELRADRIELSGPNYRYIECSGSVTGLDSVKGMLFKTERLVYDRESKLASLEGNSSIEDKQNELVAKARFIEYNDLSGVALLQVAVRIFKGELVCRSEYALYNKDNKTLDLSGRPVVFRGSDRFNAERIFVDLETEDVRMEGSVSGSISTPGKAEPSEASRERNTPTEPDTTNEEDITNDPQDALSNEPEQEDRDIFDDDYIDYVDEDDLDE